jgi:hypothetical protein
MSDTTLIRQDSFEKARAAFFGKSSVTSSKSDPATSTVAQQTEPVRESSGQLTATAAAS